MKFEKQKYWKVGFIFTIVTFIMFFVGVKVILGNDIKLRNIVGYVVFSLLVGVLSLALVYWRFIIALWGLIVGLALGFFVMYRSFFTNTSGWGDLIGVISLFTLISIGIGVGVIAQFGYYLYKRYKSR